MDMIVVLIREIIIAEWLLQRLRHELVLSPSGIINKFLRA